MTTMKPLITNTIQGWLKMTKKAYVKPTMEIVDAELHGRLLAGSGSEEGNPYWDPPETPEGCQSAWWCGH